MRASRHPRPAAARRTDNGVVLGHSRSECQAGFQSGLWGRSPDFTTTPHACPPASPRPNNCLAPAPTATCWWMTWTTCFPPCHLLVDHPDYLLPAARGQIALRTKARAKLASRTQRPRNDELGRAATIHDTTGSNNGEMLAPWEEVDRYLNYDTETTPDQCHKENDRNLRKEARCHSRRKSGRRSREAPRLVMPKRLYLVGLRSP